jgi:hypothetical protein
MRDYFFLLAGESRAAVQLHNLTNKQHVARYGRDKAEISHELSAQV